MSADVHKFHPECFQCSECRDHIGDAEEYILVERSKVYDRKCFEGKIAPHTIHLIRVNLEHKINPIKLSIEQPGNKSFLTKPTIKIAEIDETVNLSLQHIGDNILEVNGISIKNASINSISDLVNCPDKVVELTIEHNTKQPVEKSKINISNMRNENERLFKKRSDIKITQKFVSQRKIDKISNNLKEKTRSASMSKLFGEPNLTRNQMFDLSRTKSFRVEGKTQRIFRAADLVQGELLGKGFFGQVYKVTEKTSGEVMVLKELYRLDEDAQKNFLKEVAVLKSLHHPNVLKFIGILYKNSKLHLITEFVPRNLNEIIHNSSFILPYTQRICFARDIATGMNYLHSKNIIHRDLNSFNCLVRENMCVIVADFGLARIISHSSSYKTTSKILNKLQHNLNVKRRKQRYTVVGNPYWMAPEMMKGNKYDEKVDIFSFGIVACELIGRIHADPDFLPRSSDFGLNQKMFFEKFCTNCPEAFYLTAFVCCDLNPDKRPSFNLIENWLKKMSTSIKLKDIQDFILNNDLNLPEFSSNCPIEDKISEKQTIYDDGILNFETQNFTNKSKDFSETGERLRNSFRAKRHTKSLQKKPTIINNSIDNILPYDTSESEPISLIEITSEAKISLCDAGQTLNKVSKEIVHDQNLSRIGKDKVCILNMHDGELSLNNITSLDNISDYDSSCDTSLNLFDESSYNINKYNEVCSDELYQNHVLNSNHSSKLKGVSSKITSNKDNESKNISPLMEVSLKSESKNEICIDKVFDNFKEIHIKNRKAMPTKDVKIPIKVTKSLYTPMQGSNREKIVVNNRICSTTVSNSTTKTIKKIEKCPIFEKTTESTRAKIKTKLSYRKVCPTTKNNVLERNKNNLLKLNYNS
uniref:non-specific serine/threonine protein kinase n=1 Tax=Culicoides sonorensis TaxID=179676 RepID=A0A336LBI2_CULSO